MNKTFRIRNPRENEFATIWPVGPDLYTVLWDEDELSCRYKKSMVEMHLAYGTWEIVSDVVKKEDFEDKLMSPCEFADHLSDLLHRQTEDTIYTSSPSAGGKFRDPDYSIWEDADKLINEYTMAVEQTKGEAVWSAGVHYIPGDIFTFGGVKCKVLPKDTPKDISSITITLDTTAATKQLEEFLVLAKNVEDAIEKLKDTLNGL